ncbi:MAG: hypothetical protein R2780_01935 [Crocinitomicaceae bacterium]
MRWGFIWLMVWPVLTQAQTARMSFAFSNVLIGEHVPFSIELEYYDSTDNALVAWPQFDKKLTDKIEILDRTVDYLELVDSTSHLYRRKQDFTLTSFDPGIHKLQPLGIELNDSMYYTNSTQIQVETVEVDTTKGITDIKGNYQVDYTFTEKVEDWFKKYWPWLAGIAGIIAVFLIVRLIRKRMPEKIEPEAPPIPAHITALATLFKLREEQAWLNEDKKEYYSELTYTVRLYLEERFGIQAIEHTTREIINDLRYADITEEDKVYLRKILSEADMVKFAKMLPDDQHGEESLYKSIAFVEKTKSAEEKPTSDHVE